MSLVKDVEYLDVLSFGDKKTGLYHCLRKPPIVTVNIAAKCSNGIALIADRKLTDIFGGKPEFRDKIFGDVAHFLMGYAGLEAAFEIFRKYMAGDVQIRIVTKNDPYTFDNLVSRCSYPITILNEIACRPDYSLDVLIAKHRWKDSQIHHIDVNGNQKEVNYIAIGSGEETANMFCSRLIDHDITMKDFMKHAYFAIAYMNERHPELGVGVEPDHIPMMKYLDYSEEWDREPSQEDIDEFKQFTNEKLRGLKEALDKILKE